MYIFSDDLVTIRTMTTDDPKMICEIETSQGYHVSTKQYENRLADSENGKSIALIAEYKGVMAGYVNVYYDAAVVPNTYIKCCKIVDFGVFEKFRNKGIGSVMMDVAEGISSEHADTVVLDVGLHAGYGSAQRMYVKRGYIPDGNGVMYGEKVCTPYENYCNDDDLVLRFSKKLY